MPIGKRDTRAREGFVREFMQGLPARMIPWMAHQLGAPQIGWGIQQLHQCRSGVVVRGECLSIETEAFLHITLLQIRKREVPAQMAVHEPFPWIVLEPGAKEGDSGVRLAVLVVEMRLRMRRGSVAWVVDPTRTSECSLEWRPQRFAMYAGPEVE